MTTPSGSRLSAIALRLGASVWALVLLEPLCRAWTLSPDLGHGWAAPALIVYLFWIRWPERPPVCHSAGPAGPWWIATAAMVCAVLPLQLLAAPYPLWPALLWIHTALLAGWALAAAFRIAGRPGVLWLGGPLTILIGALPWPSQADLYLVSHLRSGMAGLAAEFCNLVGRPALASGTTIRLGSGWVGVDEACGGIRSLQAAVMVALFLGEWLRLPFLRRAGLVLLGAFAAVAGNLVRVVFLALLASSGEAAFKAAHGPAGWIALGLSLALTGCAAWRWAPSGRSGLREALGAPVRGIPGGLAAWVLATAGLFLVDAAGADWWYGRGAAANAGLPLWTAQLPEGRPDFRDAALDDESRDILQPDFFSSGSWGGSGSPETYAYYIEWRRGTVARFIPFLHNPTVCLPMAGCELEASLGVVPVRWSGGVIPFNAYLFRRAGAEMTVAFAIWDTGRDRPLERPAGYSGWGAWFGSRWGDVREARRDQPAQLLSVSIAGRASSAGIAATLAPIIVKSR